MTITRTQKAHILICRHWMCLKHSPKQHRLRSFLLAVRFISFNNVKEACMFFCGFVRIIKINRTGSRFTFPVSLPLFCPSLTSSKPKITASDYYQFDDLLTPEEQAIRMKVRECAEKEVAPIMTKVFSYFTLKFEDKDFFPATR